MFDNARGGDPVSLGSCLSGLEAKQQFDAWTSMFQLGMLDDEEIAYDAGIKRFTLAVHSGKEEDERTGTTELG